MLLIQPHRVKCNVSYIELQIFRFIFLPAPSFTNYPILIHNIEDLFVYSFHYAFQPKQRSFDELRCLYSVLLNITFLILIGYHENVGTCAGFLVFCNGNRNSRREMPISLHWKSYHTAISYLSIVSSLQNQSKPNPPQKV